MASASFRVSGQCGPEVLRLANTRSALGLRDGEEKRLLDAILLAVPGWGESVRSDPITEYVITPHARFEMSRRGLSDDMVRRILSTPEQRLDVRPGRVVVQSRIAMGAPPRMYLIRAVVDIDRQPAEVVTVYRTNKISKYWEEPA